ncbi:hypothetical protein KAR91_63080 [Candidatus Pacearchaeota archaeon]|nr:hypothetical protein [Candidatus Pacearchaeota archaeon]
MLVDIYAHPDALNSDEIRKMFTYKDKHIDESYLVFIMKDGERLDFDYPNLKTAKEAYKFYLNACNKGVM